MNEDKYYTPVEEDIHVGLEVEIRSKFAFVFGENTSDSEYTKMTITKHHSFFHILNGLGNFRIKRLDHDDIMETGWMVSGNDASHYDMFLNNMDKQLYFRKEDGFVEIYDGNKVFEGTIRNKSELKQVMKMVGI